MGVLDGSQTVGVFLANTRMLRHLGKAWLDMYVQLLEMQSVVPDLERITRLINAEVDVLQRIRLMRLRIEHSLARRSQNGSCQEDFLLPDDVPILVENVSFQYRVFDTASRRELWTFTALQQSGKIEIPQCWVRDCSIAP